MTEISQVLVLPCHAGRTATSRGRWCPQQLAYNAAVLAAWQAWGAALPDSVWSQAQIGAFGNGQIGMQVIAVAADAALIAAAKKEGSVVWYTSLIIDQLVRPAVDASEKEYAVKVEYVRMDPNDIALKIAAEGRAGQMRSDISDGFGMPGLVKAGYVDSWLPDHVKKWPQQYFDPKGYWTATNFFVLEPGFTGVWSVLEACSKDFVVMLPPPDDEVLE